MVGDGASLVLDSAASAARRARALTGGGWYWTASRGWGTALRVGTSFFLNQFVFRYHRPVVQTGLVQVS